jgi:hypothetical protein
MTVTGAVGSGGGTDILKFDGVAYANLLFITDGSVNLYVTSTSDWSDNSRIDDGVMIQCELRAKFVTSHYPQVAAAFLMKVESGGILWLSANRALR